MKRVTIIPMTEISRFSGWTVIVRGGLIAALMSESYESRTRAAFDSEDEFETAIASGKADRLTFNTEEDAIAYAVAKVDSLNAEARRVEEAISRIATFPQTQQRKPPLYDAISEAREAKISA